MNGRPREGGIQLVLKNEMIVPDFVLGRAAWFALPVMLLVVAVLAPFLWGGWS